MLKMANEPAYADQELQEERRKKTHQFNVPIHIYGTATSIQGQHFRGKLSDIDPETMEYYNAEEKTRKTYNLELWDSLPGLLEDPPSTDLEFQDRATSCVAKALDNLYFERSTNVKGEEVKSWLFKEDPNETYSWFETELMEGFFYDMHKSRGRIAVHSLLKELFSVEENIRTHNIGGSITKWEPCVRQIVFILKPDTDWSETLSTSSFTSSSSRSYLCLSRLEETEDLLVNSRLRPPPPPGSSALGTKVLPWYRCLVPDIIIEKRQGTQRQEMLAVSIKGGHKLDQKSLTQIKYEMLPMLTKHNSALGLLLCASKAMLFRFTVIDHKPCLKGKEYDFTTDEFVSKFVEMCCDLQYYIHLID